MRPNRRWAALLFILSISVVSQACASTPPIRIRDGSGPLVAPGAPAFVGHYADPGTVIGFSEAPLANVSKSPVRLSRIDAIADDGAEVVAAGVIRVPPSYTGTYFAIDDPAVDADLHPEAWRALVDTDPRDVTISPGGSSDPPRIFLYAGVKLKTGRLRGGVTGFRVRFRSGRHSYTLITHHQLLLCRRTAVVTSPCEKPLR